MFAPQNGAKGQIIFIHSPAEDGGDEIFSASFKIEKKIKHTCKQIKQGKLQWKRERMKGKKKSETQNSKSKRNE